jgi:ribosomal protein S18 acetylase RimI-like enzyme
MARRRSVGRRHPRGTPRPASRLRAGPDVLRHGPPDARRHPAGGRPEGFAIRPVGPGDLRTIFDAGGKAFRDHWGSVHDDEASFERFSGDPRTDTSLFVVAFAGEEVAGAVLNVIDDEENAMFDRRRGLLDSVFVRRPYRQRGLGRALVLRSLEVLRERGMTSAFLGVDSENPNAALHLYEACGFERARSSTSWRKPLDVAARQ